MSSNRHPFEGPEVFDDEPKPEPWVTKNGPKSRIFLINTTGIADVTSPTVAEIQAGVDITDSFEELNPWPYTSEAVRALYRHRREEQNLGRSAD